MPDFKGLEKMLVVHSLTMMTVLIAKKGNMDPRVCIEHKGGEADSAPISITCMTLQWARKDRS